MKQTEGFNAEKLEIRTAIETDVEALASLVAERGFDYPTDVSLVRARFKDLTDAGDRIIVAVHKSSVVGMALLHRTRFLHRAPDGRIASLVIAENYRSFGIGGRLIEAAETVFRGWGCGRIEVTSGAGRGGAHKFYLREGFEEKPKRFIKSI